MGDIIETTVEAFAPNLYYKISDNGTWFDVKTRGSALVGLAEEANARCRYWFDISNPGTIRIVEGSNERKSKSGLGFTLTEDHYNRFWFAWDSKHLWVGVGNSGNVVMMCPISGLLNYITFTTRDRLNTCSIKFAIPPLSLTAPLVSTEPMITSGKLQWKSCENQLPDEAVIGGYIDGEIVYVVRAHHRGSLTPGVFVPSKGLAFIPWGGSDNPTSDFEALNGYNLLWKSASTNQIPVDAFVAGYSEVNKPLYIGRALYEKNKIPGRVQCSKCCYITYQGREIAVHNFEVLTEPGLNALCGFNLVWKSASTNRIPVDAFVAGYSEDRRHEPLYIGRASFENNKIPGKVQISHRVCYIAFQEREIAIKNFEVLTEPGLNVSCANEYIVPMSDIVNLHNHNEYDDGDMSDDDDDDAYHNVVQL